MGGLFGSKAKAPAPTPVARMPDVEDPAIKEARRKAAAASQARSGRAATVLTSRAARSAPAASGAGGTAYTNSLLGQAG
jgi:hypothetical protein